MMWKISVLDSTHTYAIGARALRGREYFLARMVVVSPHVVEPHAFHVVSERRVGEIAEQSLAFCPVMNTEVVRVVCGKENQRVLGIRASSRAPDDIVEGDRPFQAPDQFVRVKVGLNHEKEALLVAGESLNGDLRGPTQIEIFRLQQHNRAMRTRGKRFERVVQVTS